MNGSWDFKDSVRNIYCWLTAYSFWNFNFLDLIWGLGIWFYRKKPQFTLFTSIEKTLKPPNTREGSKVLISQWRKMDVLWHQWIIHISILGYISLHRFFVAVFWNMDFRIWCMNFAGILLIMLTSVGKAFSQKFMYTNFTNKYPAKMKNIIKLVIWRRVGIKISQVISLI